MKARAFATAASLLAGAVLLALGASFGETVAWAITIGCLVLRRGRTLAVRAAVSRLGDAVRDGEVTLEVGVGGHGLSVRNPVIAIDDYLVRIRRLTHRAAARTQAGTQEIATLQRQHEETLTAVRGRSDFMANLCHEIRTPLNGLLGFLTMLNDTTLDDQQREWVGIARNSGESLLALLNDVLDLAKIEAGKLTLERIEFDRDELFENVAGLFAPSAQARGVDLLLDLDASLPARLVGDPVRLRQVVANLVGNAVKFTPRGHVELAARATERSGGRIQLEISVTDSGVGIPPERLTRLFAPFEQAELSTARRFGGTGLGLAIVKRIVEQMTGEISVDSEVGRGTRFVVSVPIAVAATLPPVPAPQPVLLLVIDAQPRRRELLAKALAMFSSHVATAADASKGLAAVRAWNDRPEPLVVLADDATALDAELLAAVRGRVGSRLIVVRPATAAYDAVADGVDCVLVRPLRRAVLASAISGQARTASPNSAATPTWPGRRVLLVEDNPVNQRLMCTLLARLGVEVLLASDGNEAVDAFGRYTFDLILMDVQMPEMDGYAATKVIRTMVAGEAVPIVALTANAQAGDRELCLAAGMNDYLTKPVRAAALRETMARFMSADATVGARG